MKRIAMWFAAAVVAMFALAACGGGDGDEDHGGSHDKPKGQNVNKQDIMFVQQMIAHHEQAIELADIVLVNGSGALTDIANRIKSAQGPEIEKMRAWLSEWDASSEHMGHGDMPGMVSDDSVSELRELDGAAADRRFAELMIEHHEGAVEMAKEEVAKGANPDAIELARTIIDVQEDEISELRTFVS